MQSDKDNIKEVQLRVDPATAASELKLKGLVSTQLQIDANRITSLRITRRSIDARQRRVMVLLTVRVTLDIPPATDSLCEPRRFEPVAADAPEAIVVGAGRIVRGFAPYTAWRAPSIDRAWKRCRFTPQGYG